MALGILKPVANINGLPCSGHGIHIPATIHSTQTCGTPPIPYSIVAKKPDLSLATATTDTTNCNQSAQSDGFGEQVADYDCWRYVYTARFCNDQYR